MHSPSRTARYAVTTTLLLAGIISAAPAAAAESIDNLVDHIIELRAEVAKLDSRLHSLKAEHRNRMAALARREGQLIAEREAARLRRKQLKDRLAELRQRVDAAGVAEDELKPVLQAAFDAIRAYVKSSLPFKRDARLAALEELETQLVTGALSPARITSRLWSFYADEIRLTEASGIHQQPLMIAGEERLAEVAHVGMMMLYFRHDGRYGYAVRTAQGWRLRYIDDANARARIEALFASLRKQIDSGFFRLPYPPSRSPNPSIAGVKP